MFWSYWPFLKFILIIFILIQHCLLFTARLTTFCVGGSGCSCESDARPIPGVARHIQENSDGLVRNAARFCRRLGPLLLFINDFRVITFTFEPRGFRAKNDSKIFESKNQPLSCPKNRSKRKPPGSFEFYLCFSSRRSIFVLRPYCNLNSSVNRSGFA